MGIPWGKEHIAEERKEVEVKQRVALIERRDEPKTSEQH